MGSEGAAEKPHAVCLPGASQGHITPMMKMAKLLHARSFHITFVNTEFNHRRLLRARGPEPDSLPDFRFAAIPDGLPPSDADATQDAPALVESLWATCLPQFLALLAKLNDASSGVPPVTCLVIDGVMSCAYDAAKMIGVPLAALWTASACGFMGYHNHAELIDRGLVPFKDAAQLTDDEYLDTVVDGLNGMCEGMRLRDFPSFIHTTDRGDILLNHVMREARNMSIPNVVLVNTFDELEGPVLDTMRAVLPLVYAVGPLHLHASNVVADGSNLWREQDGLLVKT